ncbi:MAG TPA: hypothetical protein VGQ12_17675 [Candidatus Angelobacter sp.]|jgi:hypothetical protein|nr:hypothetical protein [Candidatus Angelobacter sp.]
MPTPQLLDDIIDVLLLLAPPAAVLSLIFAGINLRREGVTTFAVGGGFTQMDVLGGGVSDTDSASQLVSSFGINTTLPAGTGTTINSPWLASIQADLASFVSSFVVARIMPTLAAFFVVRAILDTTAGSNPLLSILSAMFLLAVPATLTLIQSFDTGTQFSTADVLDNLWNHLAGTILPIASVLAIVGAIVNFALNKPFLHLVTVALAMLSVTAIWKLVLAMMG